MRCSAACLCLTVFLLSETLMLGQTPVPQKDSSQPPKEEKKVQAAKKTSEMALEDLLALALKNNGDIRVGEAKLREAEAELYRTRMHIFGKVVTLRNKLNTAKFTRDEATARYETAAIQF